MVVAFLYLIFKPFDFGPFLGGVDVILLKLDLLSTISLYHLCLEERCVQARFVALCYVQLRL